MGAKFEIEVWAKYEEHSKDSVYHGCRYEQFWSGSRFLPAVWHLIRAKCKGHGCVTLHWR